MSFAQPVTRLNVSALPSKPNPAIIYVLPDGKEYLGGRELGSPSGAATVVAVLGPADAANFNNAADAAHAAAVAAGGGIIYVMPGEYQLTRSMPFVVDGVQWIASLPKPGGEIGVIADRGVRLIAATKYAYDCFTCGQADAGALVTGQPVCIEGVAIKGFYIEGFRFGIKVGALHRYGLFASEVSNNVVYDCSEWGIWLENFFHTPCHANRVNECWRGQIAAVASAQYNTGNSAWTELNANGNQTRISRGIVFMCRGDVAGAGALNDMYVAKLASVAQVSETPDDVTVTPAGVGSTLLGLSAANIAKLYVQAPVWFGASTQGVGANRCYFVRSIDTGANQITLSDKPDGGFAASVAIIFSGVTPMTMKVGGAPNLEIIGSPRNEIQPSSFVGLNLEIGPIRMVVYKTGRLEIRPQLCQGSALSDIVVREAAPIITSTSESTRIDFDTASKPMQRYGRWFNRNSTGGQSGAMCNIGMYTSLDPFGTAPNRGMASNTMGISFSGTLMNLWEPARGTGVGIAGSLLLWHNQVNSGGDPKGGGIATMMSNGGTLTIAASSDSALPYNVGELIFISNPQATACTINSVDGLRFIGKGLSGTSYSLPANTGCTVVLQKDGTGLYWAVY